MARNGSFSTLMRPVAVGASGAGAGKAKEPLVCVEHLYKEFNGNEVLEDINLRIYPGQELSIVGASGCGKTVLTKHFNGLLVPDRGRVIVCGIDLSEASEDELEDVCRQIGYVFQGNALFTSAIAHDVYENVSLPLRPDPYQNPARNEAQIEARVAQALEEVGLGREFFDRTSIELSGGERKRVAVARAIVNNPPIIIYDEPTTGLDPGSTMMVIDLIDKLYQSNRNTTIAITHEKKLMERLRTVIFLKDQRIYFDGPYEDFVRSADPVIVSFLAESDDKPYQPKTLKQTG